MKTTRVFPKNSTLTLILILFLSVSLFILAGCRKSEDIPEAAPETQQNQQAPEIAPNTNATETNANPVPNTEGTPESPIQYPSPEELEAQYRDPNKIYFCSFDVAGPNGIAHFQINEGEIFHSKIVGDLTCDIFWAPAGGGSPWGRMLGFYQLNPNYEWLRTGAGVR